MPIIYLQHKQKTRMILYFYILVGFKMDFQCSRYHLFNNNIVCWPRNIVLFGDTIYR